MATKKIWISRDLKGDENNDVVFWKNKPVWDHRKGYYESSDKSSDISDSCHSDAIGSVGVDCSDLSRILSVIIGIDKLAKGQVIELTASTKSEQGQTLAEKAQNLVKKMKSKSNKPTQKEVLVFLDELSQEEYDEDDDEDDDDEGNDDDYEKA